MIRVFVIEIHPPRHVKFNEIARQVVAVAISNGHLNLHGLGLFGNAQSAR